MKTNKSNRKSTLLVILAVLLTAIISVAGTLAYLTKQTKEVTNTFTAMKDILDEKDLPAGSDEAFKLVENKAVLVDGVYKLTEEETYLNEYKQIVPQMSIPKNPKLSVNLTDNARAYIFVEVYDDNSQVSYQISDAWEKLDGVQGVNKGDIYVYKTKEANVLVGKAGKEIEKLSILKGNSVTANSSLNEDTGALKFYGYLCQADSFKDAKEAFTSCFKSAK